MSLEQRTVVWRGLSYPSMEFFSVRQRANGWQMTGIVVAILDEQPLHVAYTIDCNEAWHTRHVELTLVNAVGERRRALDAAGDGSWQEGGQVLDAVHGCVDVDLGITPATNTLPIKRLQLAVGESADVVATWVRFPSLTIQPLSQRYTRLSGQRYHYESDTGFECDLDVDDDGIVIAYPGGWEALA